MNPNREADTRRLLHAYLDGELCAAAALDMERRLATDPGLAAEYMDSAALQRTLREHLAPEPMPQRLRDAILDIGAPKAGAAVVAFRRSARAGFPQSRARLALAAAALILALWLGSSAIHLASGWNPQEASASSAAFDAAVAGHVRALAAGTPVDVASADRHTVKPWFAGKVTFAPQVVDLTEDGFALAGGRVDVIAGRIAATLVFRHGKHVLSLTEALDPGGRAAAPTHRARDGFSVEHWATGGIGFWAVCDGEPKEVDAFAIAFRAKTSHEAQLSQPIHTPAGGSSR